MGSQKTRQLAMCKQINKIAKKMIYDFLKCQVKDLEMLRSKQNVCKLFFVHVSTSIRLLLSRCITNRMLTWVIGDSRTTQPLKVFLGSKISAKEMFSLVSYTVSNKNTNLADFETCVFRGYLRNHLSYKKHYKIYLHPCLKSFQMKK